MHTIVNIGGTSVTQQSGVSEQVIRTSLINDYHRTGTILYTSINIIKIIFELKIFKKYIKNFLFYRKKSLTSFIMKTFNI